MNDFTHKLCKLCKLHTPAGLSVATLLLLALPSSNIWAQDPVTPPPPAPPATPVPAATAEDPGIPPKPEFIPPDLVPVVEQMDIFFKTLAKVGSATAYKDLLKGSGLLGQSAMVADVITNTDQALETFGNIDGFERIELRRTGHRLVSITYIGYTPRWPIRWNFVAYYGGGRWQILDIDISNQIDLMIDRGRKREAPPK